MTEKTETQLVEVDIDKKYADQRREMRPKVNEMCGDLGLQAPEPFTAAENRLMMLANHWLDIKAKTAAEHIDGLLLPELYEKQVEANIPRRAIEWEKVRHFCALWTGRAVSVVAGIVFGVLKSLLMALVIFFSEIPIVALPFFFVGIGVFILYMRNNAAQFTPLQAASIWGTIAAVTAFVAYAGFLAAMRHRAAKVAGSDGDAPHAVVIRRTGGEE